MKVTPPPSKSHALRLILADFLAGDSSRLAPDPDDCSDVREMKAVLGGAAETLNSAAVARFLTPLLPRLRSIEPRISSLKFSPRLAERLESTETSQTISGKLFAAPFEPEDIAFDVPYSMPSREYVDMTLDVLKGAGIIFKQRECSIVVHGGQSYRSQPETEVEADWSSAAFLYAAKSFGADIEITGLNPESRQPDRAILDLLADWSSVIDVSQTPDLFPVLTVLAAAKDCVTLFVGTERLRFKESDRVLAMETALKGLGREVRVGEDSFEVRGSSLPFSGGEFRTFDDHRVAMSLAVASIRASSPVKLDNYACVDKSYPGFWRVISQIFRDN